MKDKSCSKSDKNKEINEAMEELLEASKYQSKILEQRNDKKAEKASCNRIFYNEENSSIYRDPSVTAEVILNVTDLHGRRNYLTSLF